MDSIKGAQVLAELLGRIDAPAAPEVLPLLDQNALPLFHWLGVEPAAAESSALPD